MAKVVKTTKTKETAKKMTSAPEKAMTKAPKGAAKAIMAKEVSKKTSKTVAPIKMSKADKKSEKIELKSSELPAAVNTDDEEEEMAEAAGNKGNAQSSGLALAAATADTAAGSLKNFRHHPDIENFYRFIYENDLRYEALEIIDIIAAQRETTKTGMKMTAKAKH
jgi:hypothetical protein